MKKLKLIKYAILLLLCGLFACNDSTTSRVMTIAPQKPTVELTKVIKETPSPLFTQAVTLSPTEEKSATAMVTPSVNIKPSPTLILTLSTPISTDTYSYKGEVIPVCAGEGKPIQPPSDFGIKGTIFYQLPRYEGLYTLGGTPLTWGQLPVQQDQDYFTFGMSPDGKWLAFSPINLTPDGFPSFNTPSIELLSNTGEKKEHQLDIQIIIDTLLQQGLQVDGFGYPSYWINNDLIQTAIAVRNVGFGTGNTYTLKKVLDPLRGELQENLFKNVPDREDTSDVGFSPDLSRGIYFTSQGLVLKNIEDNIELWRDKEFVNAGRIIILWAPDSSMAMVANLDMQPEYRQYFLIDRDGKTKRTIANATFPYPGFYLYDLQWAADSQYLVFVSYGDTFNLIVYDVHEDQYVFHCPVYGNVSAYWSPNGQQIAFSLYSGGPLQVLDIQTGQIVELLDYGTFVGWSEKFPVQWP